MYYVTSRYQLEDLEGDLDAAHIKSVTEDHLATLDTDGGVRITNIQVDVVKTHEHSGPYDLNQGIVSREKFRRSAEFPTDPDDPNPPQPEGDDAFARAGAAHPWDEGLSVFPQDHPLHEVEKLWRAGEKIIVAREVPLTGWPEDEGRTKLEPILELEKGE